MLKIFNNIAGPSINSVHLYCFYWTYRQRYHWPWHHTLTVQNDVWLHGPCTRVALHLLVQPCFQLAVWFFLNVRISWIPFNVEYHRGPFSDHCYSSCTLCSSMLQRNMTATCHHMHTTVSCMFNFSTMMLHSWLSSWNEVCLWLVTEWQKADLCWTMYQNRAVVILDATDSEIVQQGFHHCWLSDHQFGLIGSQS